MWLLENILEFSKPSKTIKIEAQEFSQLITDKVEENPRNDSDLTHRKPTQTNPRKSTKTNSRDSNH